VEAQDLVTESVPSRGSGWIKSLTIVDWNYSHRLQLIKLLRLDSHDKSSIDNRQ
jgi:hypothetical protein